MGAIKRNITDVSAIYVGSTDVTKIYRGASLVWEGGAPPTPIIVNTFEPFIFEGPTPSTKTVTTFEPLIMN